jgi:CTP:molybdopterin cytidylyltransferase MocA
MVEAAARHRPRIACVLLAAGGSSRLGLPKQLARRRMRPLILNALAAAREALDGAEIVVVLGASALRLRGLLRRHESGVRIALNPRWHSGLAGSLKIGLAAAPPGIAAILVLLVDQPNVDGNALRRLLVAWRRRPSQPAAAYYSGRAGVPAILPRQCWRTLRELDGDAGARALLRSATPTLVGMPEAAFDVDTPDDLARLR